MSRRFSPLTADELGTDFSLERVLRFGSLPAVCTEQDNAARTEVLEAYAESYLTQEIRQEAVVRDLASFARFLEVAALMNAQVTNVAAIARDAGVARHHRVTTQP